MILLRKGNGNHIPLLITYLGKATLEYLGGFLSMNQKLLLLLL